jgi:hypothetical protein
MQNKKLKTKIRFYKVLAVTVFHGSETWVLTKTMGKQYVEMDI